MELEIELYQEIDEYDEIINYQEINDNENDIHFSVSNLNWTPEDAYIERDLFSADDYVRTLNKGIELAKKGYTKVKLIGGEK